PSSSRTTSPDVMEAQVSSPPAVRGSRITGQRTCRTSTFSSRPLFCGSAGAEATAAVARREARQKSARRTVLPSLRPCNRDTMSERIEHHRHLIVHVEPEVTGNFDSREPAPHGEVRRGEG